MVRWSRRALVLSCATGIVVALSGYAMSPERVPVHYELSGVPDRWGSRLELLLVYAGAVVLMSTLFLGVPELLRYAPARSISIPNKHYWLAPEHREEATRKLALWSDVQGAGVNLLLIALQLVLAPTSGPSSTLLPIVLAGFGAFTLGSMIWLSLAYRLPVDRES